MPKLFYSSAIVLFGTLLPGFVIAQDETQASKAGEAAAESPIEAPSESPAESMVGAIENVFQSYVSAFNQRDPEALERLWTSEAVYTIRSTGEQFSGRTAIGDLFKSILDNDNEGPASKLALEIESLELVSPSVSVARGVAFLTTGDADLTTSQFSSVFVKRDAGWLIDRVTEEELVIEQTHYEQLKSLEWMIGEWVDADENIVIEMICDWTAKQNFISRKFTVSDAEGIQSTGLQIIGWDAKEKLIRSWLFDSSGSVVTGTWAERDGQWVVQSVATLADGANASFTSIFKPKDDGTYSWQKVNQVVDGQLLPNLDEVVVRRK